MISPEIIRRYPFFVGLSHEQVGLLAQAADELNVETGYFFFHEGDQLSELFLVREGTVEIVVEFPGKEPKASLADQLTGEYLSQKAVVSNVGPGEVFGWSGLIRPNIASAGARATTLCRVVAFDCMKLQEFFADDPAFGCLLIEKIAQVIASRLSDLRIESLALKIHG